MVPEAELSPTLPLAAASKRLHAERRPKTPKLVMPPVPKPRGQSGYKVSPDLVIGMKAAGISQTKIAQALKVAPSTVVDTLARTPHSYEKVAELREALKGIKMERAHKLEAKLWTRLEAEVDSGDAKSVDAVARALLASEKIQAAASGEAHASGSAPSPPTNHDLAGLIQILIANPS